LFNVLFCKYLFNVLFTLYNLPIIPYLADITGTAFRIKKVLKREVSNFIKIPKIDFVGLTLLAVPCFTLAAPFIVPIVVYHKLDPLQFIFKTFQTISNNNAEGEVSITQAAIRILWQAFAFVGAVTVYALVILLLTNDIKLIFDCIQLITKKILLSNKAQNTSQLRFHKLSIDYKGFYILMQIGNKALITNITFGLLGVGLVYEMIVLFMVIRMPGLLYILPTLYIFLLYLGILIPTVAHIQLPVAAAWQNGFLFSEEVNNSTLIQYCYLLCN